MMQNHEELRLLLRLKDPDVIPTTAMIEPLLKESFAAYEAFQEELPSLEIEQDWQWYTPYKAWFAKGQHFWTTPRGTQKEKTLYWLYVYDGYFSVAVWFKSKNREALLNADVSEQTKQLIHSAQTMGKLPTFPVVFDVTTAEPLADIYALIDCKKRWEL
jgi:hypothetical protein